MAFVKYEPPTQESKPKPSVRVGKLGISIDQDKFHELVGEGVEFVNLYFDAESNAVGITKTTKDDKAGFKVTKRGKGTHSYFVGAGKFYAQFAIPIVDTITSELENIQGYAAFILGEKPSTGEAPRRRGRKAKGA